MMLPEPEHHRETASEAADAKRKPYEAPAIRVYGDVAALTRAVGMTLFHADGGSGAMSKTQ